MSETKVPPPALFSESFEKARRNTLVWSGLAIAAELAQTPDHKLKSSIVGGDASLPVAMVSLIFIFLSAFHLYAFYIEKLRIERWNSDFAKKGEGENIQNKIVSTLNRVDTLLLETDRSNSHLVYASQQVIDAGKRLENEILYVVRFWRDLSETDRQDNLSRTNVAVQEESFLKGEVSFESLYRNIHNLQQLVSAGPGPGSELRGQLENFTAELSKISGDIDRGEQRHFRWYEVRLPIAALAVAVLLWIAALCAPDFPLTIRNAFIR